MCAQLEDGGLVSLDSKRRWTALVDAEDLRTGAKKLGDRFEIERRQDERRLRAVTEYVATDECRSVFLREWFGETDPPVCGTCDRCAPRPDVDDPAPRLKRSRRGGRGKAPTAPTTKKGGQRRSRAKRSRRSSARSRPPR